MPPQITPADGQPAVYDVAVLGGGNAGLCAAIRASQSGARVIVLEGAPWEYRGGNSRHTRNLRCMHDAPAEPLTDVYAEDEYLSDLLRVTGNKTDEKLARIVIRETANCPAWLRGLGVRFQASLRGTLHLSRTNAFFLGGGKALINSLYAAAQRRRR
jgi:tricarballylate dehydrogenase